jgi:hypothetical protein
MAKALSVRKLSGRAVYSRPILRKAFAEVMAGKHPKEEGGCLFVTEQMRQAQLNRTLAEQTNNHLVRHRLLVLERLQRDIIKEYTEGDKSRIGKITIEVNRDLREMSGKTAKEKAQDLGLRLANFKSVVKKLEEAFEGKQIRITPGLIRKARIAEDMGWVCPYIEALRPGSDPRKAKRRGAVTGPIDDDLRRWKRKELLLKVEKWDGGDFLPADLTVTSQLVRLGAQVLKREFVDLEDPPVTVSLPGAVTGEVRKAWDVLGCLSKACPQVLDAEGKVKTKTEIRDITHLHHALDACVIGFAAHFIPNSGRVWELITKRRLTPAEQNELVALKVFTPESHGEVRLNDLKPERKEQIRQRLAERRVVQHIPKRITGLRVEQNTWRVQSIEGGDVTLTQRVRQPDGKRPRKQVIQRSGKLIGLEPGKLQTLKGALVIGENFGVALDPTPTVIHFHKVWSRLRELKKVNGGKMPRVLRNGHLIRVSEGSRAGLWRVTSIKQTEAYGLALDLAYPDSVGLNRPNAPILQLQAEGLTIVSTSLTGFDASAIMYAAIKRRPRKLKTEQSES